MKILRWLDEHFELVLLATLLVVIACVELLQVICRNVPFVPALEWAEEFCRFAWIASVFISIPYCVRTMTQLRVTALIDFMPFKLKNIVNIVVDIFTFVILAIMSYASVGVFFKILASGELSPAMQWPMWIMYAIVVIGFVLGTLRSLQMAVMHIKRINEKTLSAAEEEAQFEVENESGAKGKIDDALNELQLHEGGAK